MADKKKFGLVMPKKSDTKVQKSSIFNDDSDDDVLSCKRPKIPQKKIKPKTESLEDSSIYEYDSIYDEMKAKQTESIAPKEKKNSRYIETLLKAADKKKKEYERRIERKVQAERDKEGDQFKDKEAFVTGAYKRKMQEREEEEERERRENMLNDMMDVTKQKDLSGFYRHFLNQAIGEEKVPVFGDKQIKQDIENDSSNSKEDIPVLEERQIKQEIASDSSNIAVDNVDQDSDIEIDDANDQNKNPSDENSDSEHGSGKIFRKSASRSNQKHKKTKHGVKLKSSTDSSKPDKANTKDSKSSQSDSDSNTEIKNSDSPHSHKRKKKDKSSDTNIPNLRHDSSSSEDEQNSESPNKNLKCNLAKDEMVQKINIYAKRTVGDLFAAAQARYFQRMAIKNFGA